MTVHFKKLRDTATIPAIAHFGDAGMDLAAAEEITIPASWHCWIPTGLAWEPPCGDGRPALFVRPRSSTAPKRGILVIEGTVDAGYRGEIMVSVYNLTDADVTVRTGERIAQGVLIMLPFVWIEEIAELGTTTDRGTDGFGSTGE